MGVAVLPSLPEIESEDETVLRSPDDVARRIICLTSVAAAADGIDREQIMEWLKREGLWEHVSPDEKEFLETPTLDERKVFQFGWRSEAIWLLLWSIGLISQLDLPIEQCRVPDMLEHVPQLVDSTRGYFIGETEASL